MEAAQVGLGHVTNKSHVTCSTLHWPPPPTSAELGHVTRAAVPCNEPTHHRIPRVSPTQPSPPLTIKPARQKGVLDPLGPQGSILEDVLLRQSGSCYLARVG